MFKILAVMVAISVLLSAQTAQFPPPPNQYSVDDAVSASAGETLTVQLPASSARGWYGFWLTVSLNSSSAQAKVCFILNGSTASATAATVNQLFGSPLIPVSRAYTSSNSSGGTTYGCMTITGSQSWNMQNAFMPRLGATVQNLSISVTPLTGTITGDTFLQWSEQ